MPRNGFDFDSTQVPREQEILGWLVEAGYSHRYGRDWPPAAAALSTIFDREPETVMKALHGA